MMIAFDDYMIRPLTSDDVTPYFEMVDKNRERLANFFTTTVAKTKTLKDTGDYLKYFMENVKNRIYFPYVIVDNKTGKFAGFLDLKNIDWSVPKSEMGCYIDEDYASKGITTKAFSLFCDYCFAEFGFAKLFLRTHENNAPARAIAEKCGFEVEGKLRSDYKTTSGELIDLIYYGRLKGVKC
jgi:ribosomal-protein-serine acetyltransferase